MKITFEQLRDALVLSEIIYLDGTQPQLFTGLREYVDLTPYLHEAVEYLNRSTNAPEGNPQ